MDDPDTGRKRGPLAHYVRACGRRSREAMSMNENVRVVPMAPTSPVIRGLRFAGDEVQFSLVLAAICQEPGVAAGFAEAVIARTRSGNPGALPNGTTPIADIWVPPAL